MQHGASERRAPRNIRRRMPSDRRGPETAAARTRRVRSLHTAGLQRHREVRLTTARRPRGHPLAGPRADGGSRLNENTVLGSSGDGSDAPSRFREDPRKSHGSVQRIPRQQHGHEHLRDQRTHPRARARAEAADALRRGLVESGASRSDELIAERCGRRSSAAVLRRAAAVFQHLNSRTLCRKLAQDPGLIFVARGEIPQHGGESRREGGSSDPQNGNRPSSGQDLRARALFLRGRALSLLGGHRPTAQPTTPQKPFEPLELVLLAHFQELSATPW